MAPISAALGLWLAFFRLQLLANITEWNTVHGHSVTQKCYALPTAPMTTRQTSPNDIEMSVSFSAAILAALCNSTDENPLNYANCMHQDHIYILFNERHTQYMYFMPVIRATFKCHLVALHMSFSHQYRPHKTAHYSAIENQLDVRQCGARAGV